MMKAKMREEKMELRPCVPGHAKREQSAGHGMLRDLFFGTQNTA